MTPILQHYVLPLEHRPVSPTAQCRRTVGAMSGMNIMYRSLHVRNEHYVPFAPCQEWGFPGVELPM